MSDEEVICAFMEPKPISRTRSRDSEDGWWRLVGCYRATGRWEVVWPSKVHSLDALHLVEERLTDEQRGHYYRKLHTTMERDAEGRLVASKSNWQMLHATAEQKIKALAQVLRPLVERSGGPR